MISTAVIVAFLVGGGSASLGWLLVLLVFVRVARGVVGQHRAALLQAMQRSAKGEDDK